MKRKGEDNPKNAPVKKADLKLKIAFDIELMQPACPLLQAAFGGHPSTADLFPVNLWLLAPTPDLRVYPIDRNGLDDLIVRTKRFHTQKEQKEAVSA